MRSSQKLVRNYIEPLKTDFNNRVVIDGGVNDNNDTQINAWINPWLSNILTLPNAYKSSVLYSIIGSDWNVVRANPTATKVNSNGLIETVGANIPRIDYLNSAPSILVENSSTNLILNSSNFENASWGKIRSTITQNTTISPDGILNADTIFGQNGTNFSHSLDFNNMVVTSGLHTMSFFVKKGTESWCSLRQGSSIGGTSLSQAWFNLDAGIIGSSINSPVDYGIEDYGNGWYRIYMVVNIGSGGFFRPQLNISKGDNLDLFLSNGTESIIVYGAMGEAGSTPTSYIATTASTVTRPSDVITVNVPAGTVQIIVTFEDNTTFIENSPGATFQLPLGRIKSVQML